WGGWWGGEGAMMSTQPQDGETAIRGALGVLHEPGTMMELRLIRRSGVVSGGFFTDPAALARAAMQWDGRAHLYVTLNPLDPAMPSRGAPPEPPLAQVKAAHPGRRHHPPGVDAARLRRRARRRGAEGLDHRR